MVVALVIIGVVFPAFFSLAGMATSNAAKFIVRQKAQYYAESKMEEIIGFKKLNWDWYKTITDYAKTESLADNYTRTVSVNQITKWGDQEIDGWEITVSVSHPSMDKDVQYTIRFSKYYEIRE